MNQMEVVLLFIRIFLFAVFAVAAIGKFLDLEGAAKSVKAFGTPDDLAKTFAVLIPFAELVFAICLLFTSFAWLGAIGVFLFLLIFIGGMISQMAQGNAPDCHCFGAIHSEPVSRKSLIRNVVFAVLALVLISQGSSNQGLSFSDMTNDFTMQFIFGLAVLVALGAVIFYLKRISEQQNQIMRRIDILEMISHDGKEVARENAGSLEDALPVGAFAPEFALENVKTGREVALEHLLMEGKPLLFFFVGPNCVPCAELLPEIAAWQNELGEKFNFVFISSGKAKENVEKFGESFKNILIQKEKEVATDYFAPWTPTVLVVNADGFIASRPAVGDTAIRELIEKIKAENEAEFFILPKNHGHEHAKPKIGETVPDFSLTDLSGKEFSSKDFQNRKTLVAFWSLSCPHCQNMLEDLKNWDKAKSADAPSLVVFSDGDAEAHQDWGLDSPILLDKGYKTAETLGMFGTPSAVLVNEKGKIVSELAIGAGNIWALVGKRK